MLDPQQLTAYLELLRDAGVREFSCDDFTVKLYPSVPEVQEDVGEVIKEIARADKAEPQRQSIWTDPKLWPQGPPRFDGGDE